MFETDLSFREFSGLDSDLADGLDIAGWPPIMGQTEFSSVGHLKEANGPREARCSVMEPIMCLAAQKCERWY